VSIFHQASESGLVENTHHNRITILMVGNAHPTASMISNSQYGNSRDFIENLDQ
jgi:hypothetical protein